MSTEWKLVPVEPTPEMIAAVNACGYHECGHRWHRGHPRDEYKAMLTASPQPAQAEPGAVTSNVAQPEREALTAIMRYAESCKEECGMDPESPQAIRNGKFASIAQMAAQGLGLIRGPSFAQPEQPEPGVLTEAQALAIADKHGTRWAAPDEEGISFEKSAFFDFLSEVLSTCNLLDQEPLNAAGETPAQHAHRWATELAISMARKLYPEVQQFEPLPDLLGVITQIDNMVTGLQRKRTAEQNARIMEAVRFYDDQRAIDAYCRGFNEPDDPSGKTLAALSEVERLLGGEA